MDQNETERHSQEMKGATDRDRSKTHTPPKGFRNEKQRTLLIFQVRRKHVQSRASTGHASWSNMETGIKVNGNREHFTEATSDPETVQPKVQHADRLDKARDRNCSILRPFSDQAV